MIDTNSSKSRRRKERVKRTAILKSKIASSELKSMLFPITAAAGSELAGGHGQNHPRSWSESPSDFLSSDVQTDSGIQEVVRRLEAKLDSLTTFLCQCFTFTEQRNDWITDQQGRWHQQGVSADFLASQRNSAVKIQSAIRSFLKKRSMVASICSKSDPLQRHLSEHDAEQSNSDIQRTPETTLEAKPEMNGFPGPADYFDCLQASMSDERFSGEFVQFVGTWEDLETTLRPKCRSVEERSEPVAMPNEELGGGDYDDEQCKVVGGPSAMDTAWTYTHSEMDASDDDESFTGLTDYSNDFSYDEPWAPWLFLETEELAQVSQSCRHSLSLVQSFTSLFRDGVAKALQMPFLENSKLADLQSAGTG